MFTYTPDTRNPAPCEGGFGVGPSSVWGLGSGGMAEGLAGMPRLDGISP